MLSSGAMGMLYVDKRTLLASEGGKFNRYIDEDGDGIFENGPDLQRKSATARMRAMLVVHGTIELRL